MLQSIGSVLGVPIARLIKRGRESLNHVGYAEQLQLLDVHQFKTIKQKATSHFKL
jgi:hypothetical protein